MAKVIYQNWEESECGVYSLHSSMEERDSHIQSHQGSKFGRPVGLPCEIEIPDEWYNKYFVGFGDKSMRLGRWAKHVAPEDVGKSMRFTIRDEIERMVRQIEKERRGTTFMNSKRGEQSER